MIDGGPLNGGASAEIVIDDQFQFNRNIQNSLESIVGVATFSDSGGQLKFQLVSAKNGLISYLIDRNAKSVMLPVYICFVTDYPPSDATPEPIS